MGLAIFGILVVLLGITILIRSLWARTCSDIYCPAYPSEPYYTIGLILMTLGTIGIILGAVVRTRGSQ